MIQMAKGKKAGSRQRKQFFVHFIKVASQLDLVRYLCDFTPGTMPIFALKDGKNYRLFAEGEKINDTHIMYYTEGDRIGRYCIYTPSSTSAKESIEITDRHGETDYRVYRLEMVEFLTKPYREKAMPKNEIAFLRVSDPRPIITSLMHKGISSETIDKVYAFRHKGESFIGTFDLMAGRDEPPWFVFAKFEIEGAHGFFRYSSHSDKVEATDEPFDNQYFYVRIINLAEPPPGFRPDGSKL